MNLYDKEDRIIELFQEFTKREMIIYPKKLKFHNVYFSIHNKHLWKSWINSSGKSDLPPDYYNNKYKIMMDVMRIDDHAYVDSKGKIINPHNQRESLLRKELEDHNPSFKEASKNGHLIIIPYTNLPSEKDHNYGFYVENYKRIIKKHIEKIPLYKENHLNYKTVFMILDESSPYFENPTVSFKKFTKVGQCKKGMPHFWWLDYNLLSNFENSDVDYLIWIAPYKHFDSLEKVELPSVLICDLKKINYEKLKKYDIRKMESLER